MCLNSFIFPVLILNSNLSSCQKAGFCEKKNRENCLISENDLKKVLKSEKKIRKNTFFQLEIVKRNKLKQSQ